MNTTRFESLQRVTGGVSRETAERLELLEAHFLKWAKVINLVSPSTLSDTWDRHVLDSAQLWRLRGQATSWVDLGSGSGFPGLVIGVLAKSDGHSVTLVESNLKKCGYLRQAAATVGLPVVVRSERVESLEFAATLNVDDSLITARAFAPLERILDWTKGFWGPENRALLHKGRGYRTEVVEARDQWAFDLVEHPSLVDEDSVILDITGVRRL